AVIPRRKDQRPDGGRVKFDRDTYKRRAVVGQCVGWLKESRAVATRFDKLAVNYLATVKLAMIQRYLRLLTGYLIHQTEPSARIGYRIRDTRFYIQVGSYEHILPCRRRLA